MEPLAPEPPVLRAIQKVRTPHGTRVARRVTCTACGAQDTIDFAPKSPTDVLCRKCALEKRGVVDPDDAAVRTRRVRCVVCARWFEVVLDPRRPNHLPNTCLDCAHGVETQQKDRSKLATRVSPKVVRARRARPPAED